MLHVQLCGRAGRGGKAARAHVFLNSIQKCSEQVKEYCISKENCRRQMMLLALGASENHPGSLPCCDSCDSLKCPSSLRFENHPCGSTRRKGRTAFKDVNEDSKATLKHSLLRATDDQALRCLAAVLCVLIV